MVLMKKLVFKLKSIYHRVNYLFTNHQINLKRICSLSEQLKVTYLVKLSVKICRFCFESRESKLLLETFALTIFFQK